MLTNEQIKRLKKGDKVLAELSFVRVDEDGDLECKVPIAGGTGDVIDTDVFFHPSCFSLPPTPPKYDPYRKFKKGDIVQRRKVLEDRDLSCMMHDLPFDTKFIVISDEKNASVGIDWDDDLEWVSWALLELVTPVEKRVSFRVGDFPVDGEWSVWKNSLEKTEIISSYKIDAHPNAYEAAVAERDRLNAEYGKEQNNA